MHRRGVVREDVFVGMGLSREAAQFCCFMEMIERCSAMASLTMADRSCVRPAGQPSLHWSQFAPYGDDEVDATDRRRRGWPEYVVNGVGLISGQTQLVPAESVFPNWRFFFATPAQRPESDGVGIAAGFREQRSATIDRALREVLEREAMMLSWRVQRWPVRRLTGELLPVQVRHWLNEQSLDVHLYDVGDPSLCSVVLALIVSHSNDQATVGGSCQENLSGAATKATLEAIMLRASAAALSRQMGAVAPEDIVDSFGHVVWAWQNGESVLAWYREQSQRRSLPRAPHRGHTLLTSCTQVFGYEPVLVDLTDPRLRSSEYEVLRVLIPGAFKKEYRHSQRFAGGARLRSLGAMPQQLHHLPHPIG